METDYADCFIEKKCKWRNEEKLWEENAFSSITFPHFIVH